MRGEARTRLIWRADRPPRAVFMGTPAFAVPSLHVVAAETRLVGVVSQPDKPQGRGLASVASPVSQTAMQLDVPLIRPTKLREPGALATLSEWQPDLLVVAAYGKILPKSILDLARLAPINVHASLLPRHRGAAPIAAAILAGDVITGVTIMRMNEQMDAGEILLQRSLAIAADETTATLTPRLGVLGADALREALTRLRTDGLDLVPQSLDEVTYAPRLTKDDGLVHWAESADVIARKVRAYTPWPGSFTRLGGRRVKVLEACAVPTHPNGQKPVVSSRLAPGTIVALGDAIQVATGLGVLALRVLQLEGKKALPAAAFAAGTRLATGTRFDD